MASDYVHLSALGCEITFEFTHSRAGDQARQLFGPLLSAPWSTPDFMVVCQWPELTRHLIRSRTAAEAEVLTGIEVYSSEFPDGTSWRSVSPPFPPVELAPLADRFVRLHGAAVSDRSGRAALILGESGFGKTTLSSELCEEYGYRLLADEDVFVHRRSNVVEPFVNGDGPWVDGTRSARSLGSKRPDLLSDVPAAVSNVGALRARDGVEIPREMGRPALLRALLDSQRPGGVTHKEGIATLARLARLATGFELPGQRYEDIKGAAGQVAALLK